MAYRTRVVRKRDQTLLDFDRVKRQLNVNPAAGSDEESDLKSQIRDVSSIACGEVGRDLLLQQYELRMHEISKFDVQPINQRYLPRRVIREVDTGLRLEHWPVDYHSIQRWDNTDGKWLSFDGFVDHETGALYDEEGFEPDERIRYWAGWLPSHSIKTWDSTAAMPSTDYFEPSEYAGVVQCTKTSGTLGTEPDWGLRDQYMWDKDDDTDDVPSWADLEEHKREEKFVATGLAGTVTVLETRDKPASEPAWWFDDYTWREGIEELPSELGVATFESLIAIRQGQDFVGQLEEIEIGDVRWKLSDEQVLKKGLPPRVLAIFRRYRAVV